MSEQNDASKLATAALVELIARGRILQAAVLRGAPSDEIERLRQDGVAVAEGYMDQTLAAAKAVRAIIDGHPDKGSLGEEGARRLLE